jgi:hypothetical protein
MSFYLSIPIPIPYPFPYPAKLEHYKDTVADCSRSLGFVGSIKALSRRGTAYLGLREYVQAFDDFQRGLEEFEPQNQECLAGMGKSLAGLAVSLSLSSHQEDASSSSSSSNQLLPLLHLKHTIAKAQLRWHLPNVSGNPKAPPLAGHQMLVVPSRFSNGGGERTRITTERCLVFGGRSGMQNTLDNTVLQFEDDYWTEQHVLGISPPHRSWHTCCLLDDTVSLSLSVFVS